jgi:hypothetical protein
MSLADYLRWLMAADRSRWQPMLWGLALFAAGAGAAVLVQPSPLSLLFLVVALVAWFVGGCAMVGYVRWFFASEVAEARKNADIDKNKLN